LQDNILRSVSLRRESEQCAADRGYVRKLEYIQVLRRWNTNNLWAHQQPRLELFRGESHEFTDEEIGFTVRYALGLYGSGPAVPYIPEFSLDDDDCKYLTDPLDFGNYDIEFGYWED
jgi:hypothetical protein